MKKTKNIGDKMTESKFDKNDDKIFEDEGPWDELTEDEKTKIYSEMLEEERDEITEEEKSELLEVEKNNKDFEEKQRKSRSK